MPSTSDHEAWAARCERFFESFKDSEWSDWAMTALFYAALHEISAFLAARRSELKSKAIPFPTTHSQIKKVLRDQWPHLSVHYESLLDRSWWARYRGKTFSSYELNLARLQLDSLREAIGKTPWE